MSSFLIVMSKNRDIEESRLPDWKLGKPSLIVTEGSIEVRRKGFSLSAQFSRNRSETLYAEMVEGKHTGSFVLVFGWCYSVSGNSSLLARPDLMSILSQHRSERLPLWLAESRLSGEFCMLSFDHLSQNLWVTCDAWAQHGFYFGADPGVVAASSHAGMIANLLRSQVNGPAYLARIRRGASFPPGQTMFSDVHRITCGNSLRFEVRKQFARVVKTFEVVKQIESMTFQEAVDRSVDVVSRTCLRAERLQRLAVDLTGGNDTRISAAVLASRGGSDLASRLTFKVHQAADHPDAVIAKRIANEFGWNLRRFDRGYDISHEPVDLLLKIAPISDGNRFPSDLARGILREEASWFDCDYLWGSVGGEFQRDHYWRHETYLMGLTNKVNYQALLLHRLYASPRVDFKRISGSRFSLADHDEYILSAYRFIGEMSPNQKNVYKLDRIFLHKYMFNADNWEHAAQRTKVFPFLTSEVLNVILPIPWTHRIGRRLFKAVIERLEPSLTRIPHDTGAPMAPLRFSNILDYTTYCAKYFYDVYSRHFSQRKRISEPSGLVDTPRDWITWGTENCDKTSIPGSLTLLQRAAKDDLLRQEEVCEIEMFLLLKALKQKYPDLNEELTFDCTEMRPLITNYQL